MKNKKGVEMNFAFIFALIVGAVILFLAVYFAISITDTGGEVTSSLAAQNLISRLEPYEFVIVDASSEKMEFKDKILIENYCYTDNNFGRQEIVLYEKYLDERERQRSLPITVTNKYVFSNKEEGGDVLQLLVKPFEIPFKVSDIIMIMGNEREYCFEFAPDWIKNDIINLNIDNVKIAGEIEEDKACIGNEINVCFGDLCSGREIIVRDLCHLVSGNVCKEDFEYGSIIKNNQEVYYYGSLIYAGIFSEPEIYNCNIERLIYRAKELLEIYSGQANRARAKDCHTISSGSLSGFLYGLQDIGDFSNPNLIKQIKDLDSANARAMCKLW